VTIDEGADSAFTVFPNHHSHTMEPLLARRTDGFAMNIIFIDVDEAAFYRQSFHW
jgi:hypothetical protein